MAGRYKAETNVARLPVSDDSAHYDAMHQERARELRPVKMTAAQRKVWDRIAPELSKLGRLKPHHVDVVAEYCFVKVRMDKVRTTLDKEGWTYETTGRHGKQKKSKPEVAQYNDDFRKWNSLVAQLGLSAATELRFNDRQGSLPFEDEFGQI